ncbi:EthD domain-containing protein [Phaeosphaeriaceae sp. PMI808]|nr:EthD domain-containing protein [Phaeosphaeriaceae sp. PMI808]
MPISVIILYTRRPDFTTEEFKSYMETTHVPIIEEVMGIHRPITFLRKYVERVESGAGDRLGAPAASKKKTDPALPVVLVGTPEELGWDMMGEMIYRDELHLQQGYSAVNHVEGQRIKDDEENFTVPQLMKIVLIGEVHSS